MTAHRRQKETILGDGGNDVDDDDDKVSIQS